MSKPVLRKNFPLSDLSTFRLGGACPLLYDCTSPDAVVEAVKELAEKDQAFVLFGGGSNVLISDHGVSCPVIRFSEAEPQVDNNNGRIRVSAGCNLDALAAWTARNGLDGLVCCSGIPGTVGGAVVGNAGAWGEQVGDVLERVRLVDREGRVFYMAADELAFVYRHSILKERDDILLEAEFQLRPASASSLEARRFEILELRKQKHPDLETEPCIGSFFRNIEPTSKAERRKAAGWFLEQAEALGLKVGGAQVFEKHANILVKTGSCTAQDVFDLSLQMQEAVKQEFGFDLIREIRLLGPFDGAEPVPDHVFH